MATETDDLLHHIAEQVANYFAESGYAFIEDDKVDGLAAVLGSFLVVAGISTNPPASVAAHGRLGDPAF